MLLDLRLNILNEYVDYFVIVEGNKTWQNNYKKLRFNIDNFKKFENKIIYIPVEDLPAYGQKRYEIVDQILEKIEEKERLYMISPV